LGRSVIVLERSRYEAVRIGETLPPDVCEPLVELGVWDAFLADGPVVTPGVASAWGQAELYDNDFLMNPYGPGWHIDRRRFDATLARCAEAAGVEVLRGTRLIAQERPTEGPWQLDVARDAGVERLCARMLIDATGRSAALARRLGARRLIHDRLVGVVGFFAPHVSPPTHDRRTLVESIEDGWWYTARSAHRRASGVAVSRRRSAGRRGAQRVPASGVGSGLAGRRRCCRSARPALGAGDRLGAGHRSGSGTGRRP
jgi:hypothetical protein